VTIPITSSSINYRFKVVGVRSKPCTASNPLPDCAESNVLHVCLTTAPPSIVGIKNEYTNGCGIKVTIPVALSDPKDPPKEVRLQI
jgi:hypothetical protein